MLLHTCCAPCSSAIIECLMKHGVTPTIYYCNPNIYPLEEYEIRKNECSRYAKSLGLEIIDEDYDHDNWLQEMKGLEQEPERGPRAWLYGDHYYFGFESLEELGTDRRSRTFCRVAGARGDLLGAKLAQRWLE